MLALIRAAKSGVAPRDNHIKRFGDLIANVNRSELQLWLNDYGALFSEIDGYVSIAWIVAWRDFVISLTEPEIAPQLVASLRKCTHQLKTLRNEAGETAWLTRLAELEAPQLRQLLKHAERFVRRHQNFLRRLVPIGKKARTNLKYYANELNTTYDPSFVSKLLDHCRQISRLRDIVVELHRTLSPFGVDPWQWPLSPQNIYENSAAYLETVEHADRGRIAIESCPLKERLLECLKEDSAHAPKALIEKFRESCIRSSLDDRALAAITPLYEYLNDEFRSSVETQISEQRNLLPIIEPLAEKLETIPAIQKFNFFRGRLTDKARAVFEVLAEASSKDAPTDRGTDCWQASIEVSALTGWKKELEATYPQLVQILSDYYRGQVRKLEKLEAEKRDLDRQLLFEKHRAQPVSREYSWKGVLVEKGRTSKRLRQVVSMGLPHGIFNLRPVWLTNPETVSQIFPLKCGLFDLVVFDEASQLPPEFAIGALFRSKRAVVSGDEHQLPPTSFFQAGVDLSSDSEIEMQLDDLEKRLEDEGDNPALVAEYERLQNMVQGKSAENLLAMAKRVLPQSWLTIHYRSRFAELIRFSNAAFYENKLRMPVACPPESLSVKKPIEVHRVDSQYSSDQTNPGEAAAIVAYCEIIGLKGTATFQLSGS